MFATETETETEIIPTHVSILVRSFLEWTSVYLVV